MGKIPVSDAKRLIEELRKNKTWYTINLMKNFNNWLQKRTFVTRC
jgi:hypothetical protein